MRTLNIDLGARSYPIHFSIDGWNGLHQSLNKKLAGNNILVISDKNVFPIYYTGIQSALQNSRFKLKFVLIDPGEKSKSLSNTEYLYNNALEAGLNRSSAILSLGGGVVGDLAGFIAATYMRGIDFIQIPTSLLAQVDSSIGGKVAVNLAHAKNIVGAFHQPKTVFINIETLLTLPPKEFSTGMAELIKHGFIWSECFLTWLEENIDSIMSREIDILSEAVYRSCSIKAKVVEEDENEKGLRAILNFGHTVGHAIESITSYSQYTHGEAVALGMIYESKIACKIGLIDSGYIKRLTNILKRAGLPIAYDNLNCKKLIELMYYDKKNIDEKIVFILPTGLGRVESFNTISEEVIADVLSNK